VSNHQTPSSLVPKGQAAPAKLTRRSPLGISQRTPRAESPETLDFTLRAANHSRSNDDHTPKNRP
jgi:hypothetical protein